MTGRRPVAALGNSRICRPNPHGDSHDACSVVFEYAVENLYGAGVVRNIASFYKNVTEGRYENETVQRSVDGVLTCILGREAAARRSRLTMDELLKENKRLEVDLTGLKS